MRIEKALLKKAAIQSVAMMLVVILSSFALQQYIVLALSANNNENNDDFNMESPVMRDLSENDRLGQEEDIADPKSAVGSLEELKAQISEDIIHKLGENYIVIKKPDGTDSSHRLTLQDLYVRKSICLDLSGFSNANLTEDMILRVRGSEFFKGAPIYRETITQEIHEEDASVKEVITRDYGKDLCHTVSISSYSDLVTGLSSLQILIELDRVYAYFTYEDENYYFIALKKPSEVYDKILVIDPGHGGKDSGALSKDEKHYEKNINLAIALELKKLLDRENIKVYYTRTEDDKVFLRPRVALANAVECDYFISIHCNSSTAASPNGSEILYYNREPKGVSNFKLANVFSQELGKMVTLRNNGVVEMHEDDIYIMNNSEVPTVLIEVGYMSNTNDLKYLNHPDNQTLIAQGIYNGIMRAFQELPVQKSKG